MFTVTLFISEDEGGKSNRKKIIVVYAYNSKLYIKKDTAVV